MSLCFTIIKIKVCIVSVCFKINHFVKIDDREFCSRVYENLYHGFRIDVEDNYSVYC